MHAHVRIHAYTWIHVYACTYTGEPQEEAGDDAPALCRHVYRDLRDGHLDGGVTLAHGVCMCACTYVDLRDGHLDGGVKMEGTCACTRDGHLD